MINIFRSILLLISIIYTPTAISSDIDVVGIRFGMSPDDVRKAVRAHNSDLMKIENVDLRKLTQSSPDKIKSLRFTRGANDVELSFGAPVNLIIETIEVIFSLTDGRAYHISRVQNLYPPVDTEKFRQTLASKYRLIGEKSITKGLAEKIIIEGMYTDNGVFDYEAMRNGKCSSWGRQVPHLYKSTCNGVALYYESVADRVFKDKTHSFRIHSTDHKIFYKSIVDAQAVVDAEREAQRRRIETTGGSSPKL